ncbi:unnamed protein product [Malus baccata var. baccata]
MLTQSPTTSWHEAFWELIGFEFHRNSEVKRVRARAILGWVTHWEVLGLVGAQSGQHRATAKIGCDNLVSEPILDRTCADEDVMPLRGVDCNIPHRQGDWIFTRPFGSLLTSGSIGTPKLSQFGRGQSHDGNKIMRVWSGPKADNIVLQWSRARDVVGARARM